MQLHNKLNNALERSLTAEINKSREDLTGLVLKRIRLLSRRRIAWLRKIWTEVNNDHAEGFNAHTEVDGYLADRDLPSFEKDFFESDPLMLELSVQINETERALSRVSDSRLQTISTIFGLNRLETDILQVCLSLAVDPNLGRVFAYLQDHTGRGYVTEALVARLFGYGNSIVWQADSPLKIWKLIKETSFQQGEPAMLECDPFIKNWILGLDGIDGSLISFTHLQPVKQPLENWPVLKLVDDIKRMLNDDLQNRLRIFIEGDQGSGRRTFASILCKRFGMSVLSLNADRIPDVSWTQVYMLAQRQAFLSNTALLWYGESMPERFWPSNISSFNLQFITGEASDSIAPDEGFIDLRLTLPTVTFEERLTLWKKHVPLSAVWPKAEMEEMVLRHESTIGQIVSVGKKMTSTITETYEALRADSGRRLGNLASQMSCDFTFDDLVVTEYVKKGIEDFIFEATERVHFWEQPQARRLFPQGRSLIGLFTGSPGTGKTMAAQVIAASLKLDIFRIDLSTVVSKYIGESSKNIERILSRARNMNVVLLFDEADSLFGKRTDIKDAHDRYANTDTNYLLQAIESYPGIVILASNKKSNIDPGFMRRLRYVLDFPKPDAAQRIRIWRQIIRELSGEETAAGLDAQLLQLSEIIEITGAQIKQAVLSALFMARKENTTINSSHLVKGLERELSKEGKGLGKLAYQNLNS